MDIVRCIWKFFIALKCSFTNKRCLLCRKEGCPWWEDMDEE